MSYDDEELAELQKRRMSQAQHEAESQRAREQIEAQKQAILSTILTPEARSRLQNIRLARPDYVVALENRLIQIAQSGRLQGDKITDEQLKQMLAQMIGTRREGKISFRRK
ncbi:MAG: DNA-binding protein [Candidatus Hodarchaeales archaeon]